MPDMWMDVDAALSEVPVNIMPLIDDTDFKTRETGIVYDQAGMDLVWNFVTTAGAMTQIAVTPTTGGDYDWAHQGDGIYSIKIPASGGVSINNDTEGFGWFTGYCTGVLPWRGPVIGFRAATLNNALIDGGDELDVNVTKVGDTSQTANDNGADINTILSRVTANVALASVCTETRLAELDAGNLPADIAAVPTAVQNRAEMDSNSTQLAKMGTIPALDGGAATIGACLDKIANGDASFDATTDALEAIGASSAAITGADGAKLATNQPNYAPAKAGDDMALVNDAISAGKYDESTAYPLKSADTGATQVARVGADGDTLETLSDQLDAITGRITHSGTANVGDTTTQITLTGGVATDKYYNGQLVVITGGTGAGQARTILNYVAAGTVAIPTRDWLVAPDNTSTFVVIANDVPSILEAGVATAGAASTITLDLTAPTTVDLFKNNFIMITGGTGTGQTRLIGAYSAGRVATILPNWTVNPDNTSIYQVLPAARVDIQGWAGNVVTGDGDWAALKAETAAIVADTNELQTDDVPGLIAALNNLSAAEVNAECDTALSDYDPPSKAEMDTAHALLATPAQVNAQVVDALATDTYAEPGQGAPGATVSLSTKIGYLYKFLRNKITNDGSTIKVYNDAGDTVDQKSTVSEAAGTVTRGEFGTGP